MKKAHGVRYNLRPAFTLSYLVSFFSLLLITHVAMAADDTVIQKYINVFSSEPSLSIQKSACKELEWAGISDVRIYDKIEKNLLENYMETSKAKADYAAWLSKALSFSGQEKYRKTLTLVLENAKHKGVRKHTKISLQKLNQYKAWNPIISDTSQFDPSVSTKINQYANMLRSSDRSLQVIGAKRINYEGLYNNDFILNIINLEVKKSYSLNHSDKPFVDAIAHMTKMLAVSGLSKYRTTVEAVANESPNKKLRKYASGYIRKYY